MAKKQILEIVKEVEKKFIDEGLSGREILMILRELENNATIALVIGNLVTLNANEKTDDNTRPGET